MNGSPKNILVVLHMAGVAGQCKLKGIFDYIGNSPEWNLDIIRTQSEFTPRAVRAAIRQGLHGIIVSQFDAHGALKEIARTAIPSVIIDGNPMHIESRHANIAILDNNDMEIGRTAAQELLKSKHVKTFAYAGHPIPDCTCKGKIGEVVWSKNRGYGFAEELASRGIETNMFTIGHCGARVRNRNALARWIAGLPQPAAIFAACDDRGREILEICREQGLSVPNGISVLGVNDDTFICTHASPPLSSIKPDFEGLGRRAMELIEKMIYGTKFTSPVREVLSSVEIVVRRSTNMASSSKIIAERILELIEANALHPLTPQDISAKMNASRQLLDLRMREAKGITVYEAIVRRRIEEVKRQLSETDDSIEEISFRCGWANPISLKNLFKRRCGISMRKWRAMRLNHLAPTATSSQRKRP